MNRNAKPGVPPNGIESAPTHPAPCGPSFRLVRTGVGAAAAILLILLGATGCSESAPPAESAGPESTENRTAPDTQTAAEPETAASAPAPASTGEAAAAELADLVTICRVPDPANPSSAFEVFRSEPDDTGDYWVRYSCRESCDDWRACRVPAVMEDGGPAIMDGRDPGRQKSALAYVTGDMGGHLTLSADGDTTVFIHTGAGGTRYYAEVAADLERRSSARTAMVRWESGFVGEAVVAPFPAPVHWGWYSRSTPEGTTIPALNRRVASIIAWSHRELSEEHVFATMGCSMGTNATFMPVLWHGLDPIIDYQLFVGGPNMWDLNAHCGRRQYDRGYCDLDGVTECHTDADCKTLGAAARCVSPRPYREINALYDTFANHVHKTTACDIRGADENSEPWPAFNASSMRFADDGDWQIDHRVDFLVNVGIEQSDTVFGGDFYWALGDFPFVFNRIQPAENRQWHLYPNSEHCDAMTSGDSVSLIVERLGL
ncbi:hypothetical protein [Elongatibacter sediminis]|uniref:Uncharacterized protein n=1 Tax=Elongatibacter sediminis TaxID=3119006 RepID=A0AAW9R521_9GAMM